MKKFLPLPAALWIVGCAPVEAGVTSFDMRCNNSAPDTGHAAGRTHPNPEH